MTRRDDVLRAAEALAARADSLVRADAGGRSGTKVLSGATEVDLGGGLGYHEVEFTVTATYRFDFDLKAIRSVDWDASTTREQRAALAATVERKVRAEIARGTRDWVDRLTSEL